MFRLTLSLGLSLVVGLGSSVAMAEEQTEVSKVLFLPLDGESAGKYQPLVGGIGNMLASQLSSRERIMAVDYNLKKQEIDRLAASGAAITSKSLDLDYVVRGSVYSLEDGISLQVKVLSMDGVEESHNFSVKADNEEEIFTAVDTMAEKVAKGVFGYESAVDGDAGTAMGLAGFTTAHPEKAYKKGVVGTGASFGTHDLAQVTNVKGVRKSPALPMDIVAMGTGDFDGDGRDEMVYASRTKLLFYNQEKGRFQELGAHQLPVKTKVNALFTDDFNGDGRDEIYLSANYGGKARSYIMSWSQDQGAQELMELRDWFIQVVEKDDRTFLAGQRGVDDAARGYVIPGVYELNINGDFETFSRGNQLDLPKGVDLLSFAYADLDGNGRDETVVLDKREHLLIYNENNELVHVSEYNYGGSKNFFGVGLGKSQEDNLDDSGDWVNFIPTRIIVVDIDGDGTEELVVGSNQRDELVVSAREKEKREKDGKIDLDIFDGGIKNIFSNIFPNLRVYDGGIVSCLSYKDGALQSLWNTNKIPGLLTDYSYQLGQQTNEEGVEEQVVHLYVAQVPQTGLLDFFGDDDSRVLSYEFSYKKSDE